MTIRLELVIESAGLIVRLAPKVSKTILLILTQFNKKETIIVIIF